MEARFAIEGLAVARAAANMDKDTLAMLREIIAAQSETDAEHVSEASAEQNRAFHFAIYRRSGSAVLLPIIESLWLQFGPYLRVASERFDGREGRGTNFHVEMVAALERWRRKAAREALESDIGRSFDLVMADPQRSFWYRLKTTAPGRAPTPAGGPGSSQPATAAAIPAKRGPGFELYDLRVEVVGPAGPNHLLRCEAGRLLRAARRDAETAPGARVLHLFPGAPCCRCCPRNSVSLIRMTGCHRTRKWRARTQLSDAIPDHPDRAPLFPASDTTAVPLPGEPPK